MGKAQPRQGELCHSQSVESAPVVHHPRSSYASSLPAPRWERHRSFKPAKNSIKLASSKFAYHFLCLSPSWYPSFTHVLPSPSSPLSLQTMRFRFPATVIVLLFRLAATFQVCLRGSQAHLLSHPSRLPPHLKLSHLFSASPCRKATYAYVDT